MDQLNWCDILLYLNKTTGVKKEFTMELLTGLVLEQKLTPFTYDLITRTVVNYQQSKQLVSRTIRLVKLVYPDYTDQNKYILSTIKIYYSPVELIQILEEYDKLIP